MPTEIQARVLTTSIDLDEGTCSVDPLEPAAEFFILALPQARSIIKDVATITATWQKTPKVARGPAGRDQRMAGAFESDDLKRWLRL